MAQQKKTKPKTMDVAHPDTVLPDTSARPVIVSNRAMLEDPMMRSETQSSFAEPTTSPLLTTHQNHVEPQASGESTEDKAGKAAPTPPGTKPRKAEKQVTPLDATVEKEADEKSTEKTPEEEKDKPLEATGKKDAGPNDKLSGPDPVARSGQQSAESSEDAAKPSPETLSTSSEPNALGKNQEEPESTEDLDEQLPNSEADADAKRAEEEAQKEAEELERAEHLKSLVNDKTYFVPTRRQGKNGTFVANILILVALLAIAGLVYINLVSMK